MNRTDQAPTQLVRDSIFHICAVGTRGQMLEFQEAAHRQITGRIQTFVQRVPRYRGTMCEILRHDAGKWAAISHLAQLWQSRTIGDLRRR